jgi:hypothetical protein
MLKKIFVGVIGPGEDKCTNEIFEFGLKLGRYLIDNEYFIVWAVKEDSWRPFVKVPTDP